MLVALSLTAVFMRGSDILDIEFRAGTQVGFKFKPDGSGELTSDREPVRVTLEQKEARKRVNLLASAADKVQAGTALNDEEKPYQKAATELVAADKNDGNDITIDFKLFDGNNLVAIGEPGKEGGTHYSGYSLKTLVTDENAVTSFIQRAFEDRLDAQVSVNFPGSDLVIHEEPKRALNFAYPVTGDQLKTVLRRPNFFVEGTQPVVSDYIGGVALYVKDLKPGLTEEELTKRLQRMRNRPPFDAFPSREMAIAGVSAIDGEIRNGTDLVFDSFVVLVKDESVSLAENPTLLVKRNGLADGEWALLSAALTTSSSFEDVTKFDSQVSGTMRTQAIAAMLLSLLVVVIYIWFRFSSARYGIAAIIALVHDVSLSMGALAVSHWLLTGPMAGVATALGIHDFKIDLAIIAALLTIVGYSLNDTIVVFDRIRENRGRLKVASAKHINDAINQTVSRTLLTSGTTFLAVATLYVLGGDGVHGFAFTMLLGVIVGTYSSIAIASPVLLIGTGGNLDLGDEPEHDLAGPGVNTPSAPGEPVGV